jgi:hypothetical protein
VGAMHPLGICKISKTNTMIKSELCEENIEELIKKTRDWPRVRAASNRYCSAVGVPSASKVSSMPDYRVTRRTQLSGSGLSH